MSAPAREALEEDIRARCAAGDLDGAATAALRGYGPEIYAFLASSHRSGDEADEVFSLFTEGLWHGLPRFEWQSSFRTWAYAVARRTSLRFRRDAHRKNARQAPLPTRSSVLVAADEVRSTTRAYLQTEVRSRVAELRDSLSPEDRDLLMLRVDRELSWIELAHVLAGDEGPPLEGDALKREAARLRKRFQLVKDRLREMARREGLLGEGE